MFPFTVNDLNKIDSTDILESTKWPISWHHYLSLESKTLKIFDDEIFCNNSFSTNLSINYKLYIEAMNVFFFLIFKDWFKNNNIPTMTTSNHLLLGQTNFEYNNRLNIQLQKFKSSNSASNYIRRIRIACLSNSFQLKSIIKKHTGYITNLSAGDFTYEYVKHINEGINPLLLEDWFSNQSLISYNQKLNISAYVDSLIGKLLELIDCYELKNSDINIGREYLREIYFTNFLYTDQCLNANRLRNQLKIKKSNLFLASNNNFFTRLLASLFLLDDNKVYTFSHGEPILYNWTKLRWMELDLATDYIEYSQGLTDILNKKKYLNIFNQKVAIKSGGFTKFQKDKKIFSKNINVTRIENVMVIGNTFHDINLSSVTPYHCSYHITLELKIFKAIISSGLNITYKAHPGSKFINYKLFERLNVKIERSKLELIIGNYDAIIFYYTKTTTFGLALCTKIPIIIYDLGLEDINADIKRDLEKRCVIIPSHTNDNNIYKIDILNQSVLSEAIEKSSSTIFFDKYLNN